MTDQLIAEIERLKAALASVNTQETTELTAANPASNLSLFGVNDESLSRIAAFRQAFTDSFKQIGKEAQTFGQITRGALAGVLQGTQQTLAAFILTGRGGGQAFKQLTADILSALAIQSAIKAVFEYAEAAAAFANLDFRGSAAHLKAAVLYGSVAAIAGGVGLGIGAAGGLGGGTSAAAGGGAFGEQLTGTNRDRQPQETKLINTERDRGGRTLDNVIITLKTEPGQYVENVERALVTSFKNDGTARRLIRNEVNGEPL